MKDSVNYRLDRVSATHIKRMPGIGGSASKNSRERIRDFARKRGYFSPVVLSGPPGSMTLLVGAATFDVCLEEKETKIPAVIVQTAGESDNLMFALQSMDLNEGPGAIAVGGAIVRLIDTYGVSRKHIAESLGKSPAWISRKESLIRRLNGTVQGMVADGAVSARSAQEIARLPDDVQAQFAVSVRNEFLNKNSVSYLVNRYLNEDIGAEERRRIICAPNLALPRGLKRRGRKGRDNSDSARLSHAVARCMDDAGYLLRLLDRMDIDEAAIRMTDVTALADCLAALHLRLQAIFAPGQNEGGQAFD